MKKKLQCFICTKPSSNQCSRCRRPYCGKICQRVDWKAGHKMECERVQRVLEPSRAPRVHVVRLDGLHEDPVLPRVVAAAEHKESCPVCLEVLSDCVFKSTYYVCCDSHLCNVCSDKIQADVRAGCPLCRAPTPHLKATPDEIRTVLKLCGKGGPPESPADP